ncbi:cupredoxin family copper-binding protein [Candidatus Woesearchaeota archaeon]|nr:cupredoxin family copper-binding protein [Candidatus Woesearchaeota archaeon]
MVIGLFSCTSVKYLDEEQQTTTEKLTPHVPPQKEAIEDVIASQPIVNEQTPLVNEQQIIEPIKPTEQIITKPKITTVVPQSTNTSVIVNVDIKSFSFKPNSITINLGDVVTWTNYDSIRHTATSDDGLFNSNLLSLGESWSYKFEQSGEYGYYCQPHTSMRGKVVVK